MIAVELEDIAVSFPGVKVFENVSLSIEQGDFVAVVGPNGSGKSTLLRLLCQGLEYERGNIRLFGQDIKKFRDWQQVSYIAQSPAQQNRNFPVLVKEVVSMGLLAQKSSFWPWLTGAEGEQIRDTLAAVGMPGYEERFFGSLSGGQKQKILLARALVSGSRLLLLDEPTSGIDADAKEELYALLRDINKERGNTVVMVSHDMELAAKAADKALCLEKGGMCYWGPAQEILLHRHMGGYYFGCTGEEHGNICL